MSSTSAPLHFRGQWGRDRRSNPLPEVPSPAGDGHIALSRIGIIATVSAWVAYVVWWTFTDLLAGGATPLARFEALGYLGIVTFLTAASLAYLMSRLGYMYRARDHHRANRPELDAYFDRTTPALTAIVPSYREDDRVIRKTLLSAALQEYPDMRVVLLIDDTPRPTDEHARQLLMRARAMPGDVQELLARPADRFAAALADFERRAEGDGDVGGRELLHLADCYDEAVRWLEDLADAEDIQDHTDARSLPTTLCVGSPATCARSQSRSGRPSATGRRFRRPESTSCTGALRGPSGRS